MTPQKYWITKPFFQTTVADYLAQRIDSVMNAIAADPSGATITDLKFAVSEWRAKPFKPHVIARSRPVAYQLALVLRYIQNLIDGDNLFRQFTRESVTQATQMYILADKLLGPKPRIVPTLVTPPAETYNQLEAKLDLFSNALLDLENMIPDLGLLPHGGAELPPPPITVSARTFASRPTRNCCRPGTWWPTGCSRSPLPEHRRRGEHPRALLAADRSGSPGACRGRRARYLRVPRRAQRASAELSLQRHVPEGHRARAAGRRASGNSLLQALEKRDAEKLARLRSEQELAVLGSVRLVKLATIDEAKATVDGLKKTRKVTEERRAYYASQSFMNTWEAVAVTLSGLSLIGEAAVAVGYILSSGLKLIPNIQVGAAGFGGTPEVTVTMAAIQSAAPPKRPCR